MIGSEYGHLVCGFMHKMSSNDGADVLVNIS